MAVAPTVSGPERSAAAASAVPAHQIRIAASSSPDKWYIWPMSAIAPPKALAAISQAPSASAP